jgi:hypothetical protein
MSKGFLEAKLHKAVVKKSRAPGERMMRAGGGLSEQEAYMRMGTLLGLGAPVMGARWSLEEFTEGWLFCSDRQENMLGRTQTVIEKENKEIRRFEEDVTRESILSEYGKVQDQGVVVQAGGQQEESAPTHW